MLLLGTFFHYAATEMLRTRTAAQLDLLASARLADIRLISTAWREQVRLIQSRTALRELLLQVDEGDKSARANLQRIVDDAIQGISLFRRIDIFDRRGNRVATSGDGEEPPGDLTEYLSDNQRDATFVVRRSGIVDTVLAVPLELDGQEVGYLEVVLATQPLLNTMLNREGMGETGEMYLVAEVTPGQLMVLHPLRHRTQAELLIVPKANASSPMQAAVSRADGLLKGVEDYRGEKIWAATRTLPAGNVGLVVKIDEAEGLAPVATLRREFARVGLSVASLAILGGALLGIWLARPVRALHDVVERITAGEDSLRADVRGEDEVRFLADAFNLMLDEQARRSKQ
jgi:HAMP domain-containing protein